MKGFLSIALTYLCLFLTSSIIANDEKSLNVISYNIRHGAGMDKLVNIERTANVLQKLKPDLIALQEVDKNCTRSQNIDIAKELGKKLGMHHHFEKFMDYQGGEYGMAILSRFPIEKAIRHQLPKGSEPRCAIEVQVKIPQVSEKLSFFCIHNDWKYSKIRKQQVNTLLKAINKYTHPIILAGDFNGARSDESMQVFHSPAWNIINTPGSLSFPSKKAEVEIDFLISRNLGEHSVEFSVIPEKLASDHRPIFAKLTF